MCTMQKNWWRQAFFDSLVYHVLYMYTVKIVTCHRWILVHKILHNAFCFDLRIRPFKKYSFTWQSLSFYFRFLVGYFIANYRPSIPSIWKIFRYYSPPFVSFNLTLLIICTFLDTFPIRHFSFTKFIRKGWILLLE